MTLPPSAVSFFFVLDRRGIYVDKLADILGTAGYPSGFVGVVLLLFFYVNKQNSGSRVALNGTLQRLSAEVLDLREENDNLKTDLRAREDEIDTLRKERRAAEDKETEATRRADRAEAKLGDQSV